MSGSPRSRTAQSKRPSVNACSASSPVPTAVISMSVPPTSSAMLIRWFSSSSTTSSDLTLRSTKPRMFDSESTIVSRVTGFLRCAMAPILLFLGSSSTTETICTGICRVAGSCFSLSSSARPCIPGSWISSVIASGLKRWASASAVSPRVATTPLKPFSRAMSRRILAKLVSSSTIRITLSPGSIESRSSS